jgi:hypothetical protein
MIGVAEGPAQLVEFPARRNDAVASPKGGLDGACANPAACARNKPNFAHDLIPLHCLHLANARCRTWRASNASADPDPGTMVEAGCDRTLRLLRRPNQQPGAFSVPALRDRPLATNAPAAQPEIGSFEHEGDARRFLDAMRARLGEFALSLHPDKTRLIEFGRFAAVDRKRRGLGKPETFALYPELSYPVSTHVIRCYIWLGLITGKHEWRGRPSRT